MLTIYETNKGIGQTILCEDKNTGKSLSYQIEWIVDQKTYYSIGLREPFYGSDKILKLYKDISMHGPMTKYPYYKLEDNETKNHILCSKQNLQTIGTFLIDIKFLLETQK
jgi:hypothetical protein